MSAFRLCGYLGLALAIAVSVGMAAPDPSGIATQVGIVAAAVLTFLAVARLERAVRGQEALVYYHAAIPVLVVAALVAWAAGRPILEHLDATALGLGAFLGCGRIGCRMAGCCHGRPWRHDHRRANRAARVPGYLVGQSLVPVPLLESALAFGLVAAGLAWDGAPGTAFGLYVAGYAVGRFALEELRGDPWRPYWAGLSEGQWTSVALVAAGSVAALAGTLPHRELHLGAASLLALLILVVSRWRVHDCGPLDPVRVRQLVRALPATTGGPARLRRAGGGLLVSAGLVEGVATYTLSRPGSVLGVDDAAAIAGVIRWLRHPAERVLITPGAAGGFHLVVEPERIPRRDVPSS